MMIEIKRKDGEYTRKWVFSYFSQSDLTLYLDYYRLTIPVTINGKKTTKVVSRYDRLMNRDNNIKIDEIPFPSDVQDEALKTFTDQIKVAKWLKS